MNQVDKQYLEILRDILDNGHFKNTRAGEVKSLFGKQMRFNLKEGLPLLTTKKVFVKGIIYELLWFLKGDTNIKYLVEHNVHIWDDDAYRWYLERVKRHNEANVGGTPIFRQDEKIAPISKDEFLKKVLAQESIMIKYASYTYGDLGPIYGKQWRSFGYNGIDQIKQLIDTLKTNPDDRRLLCVAFNPDMLKEMALPPCHVMFQFYTRELSKEERVFWLYEHSNGEFDEYHFFADEVLDENNVPKRALSCLFTMRSNDFCAGNPYNIASYAFLTYMICEVCNMVPDELIYNGGDVHVYLNHEEGARTQLTRKGSDTLPTLKFARKITDINDFQYEDFIIENYNPDPPIKYLLNVG